MGLLLPLRLIWFIRPVLLRPVGSEPRCRVCAPTCYTTMKNTWLWVWNGHNITLHKRANHSIQRPHNCWTEEDFYFILLLLLRHGTEGQVRRGAQAAGTYHYKPTGFTGKSSTSLSQSIRNVMFCPWTLFDFRHPRIPISHLQHHKSNQK